MRKIRNYKHILLISIIIFLSIIGIGISYFIIKSNSDDLSHSYQTYYGDIYFEYEVKSYEEYCCDNVTLNIIVSTSENTVIFDQNISSYCCPPITDLKYFFIELELSNNSVIIREIFDPKGSAVCRCHCPYGINGKISNLSTGSYNLTFIKVNRYVDQIKILKIFEVNI